jgi:predicted Zn-dependent protease
VNDNDEMSDSVDAAADIMAEATRLLAQYDPARALARFDEALTRVGTSPIARAGRVRALWMLRRGEEARLELDELVGDFPADPDVAVAQGTVALGMRDNPVFLDIGWGACFQDLTEAKSAFDRARELAPRSPEAIRGQAVVLRLRGDYASASQLLELGQHAALLVERAYCEYDQSHLTDAVRFLRAALGVDPFCVEAQAALCLFLDNRLGAHEEALTLLEQVRRSGVPTGPAIDEVTGWVFTNGVAKKREPAERAEARRKAREAFESVLETEPRRIGAICGLAWLDYDEHGPRAGRTRIDEALAVDPYSPHLNYTRGRMLLDLRTPADAARAQECFQLVRDQAPYVIYCWSGLADAALAVDDLAAATEVWEGMRRRFPGNTTTFRVGSNLAMNQSHPQDALDLADEALRVAPDRRDLVEQRAAVLLNIGYHAEASQEDDPLQLAARRWPGDISLRWRLLLRAEAEGRLHEALGTCQEIRTLDPRNQPAMDKEHELRRQIRRRPYYRLFGERVDAEALRKAAFSADEAQGLARHVPADTRLAVTVKLRTLLWRDARQTATEEVVLGGTLSVLLLFASVLVVAGVPWLGGYFGDAGLWNIGRSVLAVGAYAMYWAVVVTASPAVIGVGCVVVASVSVWSLLPGESGVHLLLRSTVMAPAAVALLFVGLIVGLVAITEHYRRRILATEAHAVLVRDLLKLLSAVEREPAAGEIAKLIESIAHAQARVIRRAGAGDKKLSVYAGHRALGVAAATCDLKQKLVCWDSRTPKILFRRASRMLDAACRSEWGRFTYRKPDLLPRQVRLRVWTVARIVFMGGVVAMGVWLVLFSRQNPDGASATLAIVTGLVAAIAPVAVPLIEYVTRHGDRFDLRKGRGTETDRPSYDESSRGRRY